MSFRQIAAFLAIAATVSAHPTATTCDDPSGTVQQTGVTHTVVAGRGGQLRFDPEVVVAEPGDIIEWHFTPKNHSVAQSSFDDPCKPLASGDGFFPGFEFPTMMGQSDNVFQLTIKDKNPIWYYCPQIVGNHCQAGMSGVINQNDNSNKTLANYKKAAAMTGTSVIPSINGASMPNPNPLSGF